MKKYFALLSVMLVLSGAVVASAETIGNAISNRTTLDIATNIAFIDPTLVFPTAGRLESWSFWATGDSGNVFAVQIYRYTGSKNDWELVYNQEVQIDGPFDGPFFYEVPAATPFNVQAGDVVGWWFGTGGGTIPFDFTGTEEVAWSRYISNPQVGDIVDAGSSQAREYSIAANYDPTPEPIAIDIMPGKHHESISFHSHGEITVAILSTSEFNASDIVDKDSLTFGRTGNEDSLAFCYYRPEDVNGDGLKDLVCHFYAEDTGFQRGDREGILKGTTKDGMPIQGSDSVKIHPCEKPPKK
jgi:hypothetical protein